MASNQNRILFACAVFWCNKVCSSHSGKIQEAILGEYRTWIKFQLLARQRSVPANHPGFSSQKISYW